MKIEKIRTYGWESALMGMRNPKDSWDKSDSAFGIADVEYTDVDYDIAYLWAKNELNETLSYDDDNIDKKTNEYDEWLIENGIINQNDNIIEYADIAYKKGARGIGFNKIFQQGKATDISGLDLSYNQLKKFFEDLAYLRQMQT